MERIDYVIVVNDYPQNIKYIQSHHLSFLSALLELENFMNSYIEDKNGIENITVINLKSKIPDFRGKHCYFIERCTIDKVYIKKSSRNYGFLFNTIETEKELRIEIVKQKKKFYDNNKIGKKFIFREQFDTVLNELIREYPKIDVDERIS